MTRRTGTGPGRSPQPKGLLAALLMPYTWRRALVTIAAVLSSAAIFAVQTADAFGLGSGGEVAYFLPVCFAAVAAGPWMGCLCALASISLFTVSSLVCGLKVDPAAFTLFSLALLLEGFLLGRAAKLLRELLADRQRIVDVLEGTLIAPELPDIDGFRLGGAFRPAGDGSELGGDFYDSFPLGPGRQLVMIGDVSGKGIEAAALTSLVRDTIRVAALYEDSPERILAVANRIMVDRARRDGETGVFCTALVAILDQSKSALRIASAGHCRPLLYHAASGIVKEVPTHGVLIGISERFSSEELTVRLDPGDSVLMYTDGATDARSSDRQLGEDGLRDLLDRHRQLRGKRLAQRLLADILDFQDHIAYDDIALLVISHL